jgi:hypothetical protein
MSAAFASTHRAFFLGCALLFSVAAQGANWLTPKANNCVREGVRQYAAIISGTLSPNPDWVAACANTSITIQGQIVRAHDCGWQPDGRVWGKFDVSDQSCMPSLSFMPPRSGNCIPHAVAHPGEREWSAIITGTGFVDDWVSACARTSVSISGGTFGARDCGWQPDSRVWGKFTVPDGTCATKLYFDTAQPRECVQYNSKRVYAAIITGENYNGQWVQACAETRAVINGKSYQSRDCGRAADTRIWGLFDVDDPTCPEVSVGVALPPRLGVRAGTPMTAKPPIGPCGDKTPGGRRNGYLFAQYCLGSVRFNDVPVEACTYDEALEQVKGLIGPSCYVTATLAQPQGNCSSQSDYAAYSSCLNCQGVPTERSAFACSAEAASKIIIGAADSKGCSLTNSGRCAADTCTKTSFDFCMDCGGSRQTVPTSACSAADGAALARGQVSSSCKLEGQWRCDSCSGGLPTTVYDYCLQCPGGPNLPVAATGCSQQEATKNVLLGRPSCTATPGKCQ